jgi:hypothetical protein
MDYPNKGYSRESRASWEILNALNARKQLAKRYRLELPDFKIPLD